MNDLVPRSSRYVHVYVARLMHDLVPRPSRYVLVFLGEEGSGNKTR